MKVLIEGAAQSRMLFDLEHRNRISQTFGLLIE